MADLPYQVEYAKTGRASCKGCKEKIDQGSVRIAVMVQSAFHDGKQPNWHHEECFFKRQRPKSVADFGKLNMLRSDDQKRIKTTVEESAFAIVEPVVKGKGKGKKRANEENDKANLAALRDFAIEYSKSSRATCRICEIKICKSEVRISKTVYDTEVGQKYGGQALWHHVPCFAEDRHNLLFLAGGDSLPGFKALTKEDQKMVKDTIKPLKTDEIPIKKLKAEPKDEAELKKEEAFEKKLEAQNKIFFKFRDGLRNYSKQEIAELLEGNSQDCSAGFEENLNLLADCMAFGVLEPCEVCKNGQYVLETYGYKCTGDVSEWTKCSNVTQNPKRRPMKVPPAFKKSSLFSKFKPKVGVRLFESAPVPKIVVLKKEEPAGVKQERKIPALKNLQFYLYGKMKSKDETKNRILKLGGLVPSKLTDTLAAVVSSQSCVDNMPDKMLEVQEKDIEVVTESFFDLIDAENGTISNALELIKQNNIAPWGSHPARRLPQDVLDGKSIPKSGSNYVSSTKSTKLKLKGGTAVDPESGLEDEAHVYKDEYGTKYTVVLGKTDVVANKNSYYKLQLLEADNRKKYWIFKSWGRIGTKIGNNKVEDCKSVNDAIKKFEECYMERTENPWEFRDNFMKVPGRYYPIDVDYGDDETDAKKKMEVDKNCKLAMETQQLIMKIFDVNIMKQTLLEFELDTEKMPLGKLSKKQIKSGYKVLSDLLNHLEKGQASQPNVIDATNKFYTLIPHNFGIDNPPLLDNVDLINSKSQMLDNLLEIEIAYSLLKSDSSDDVKFPIESHYIKLKTEIAPLDKSSQEYEFLMKYVTNTHAATHSQYKLDVEQIFKVVREGEDKRYKPFKKLHNRRLLWHGSRTTNFAGILSQGLRIAPPEAPSTGYMFGKGIYFADMVSKSANYCCTNKSNPVGIMMLCEVALGDMQSYTRAEYVIKLPSGKHSVWGQGRTEPNPSENLTLDDGTIVPLGKPVNKKIQSSLLYNEFIVYDVAQVNVKYLFQMKFSFKY